jgi:hypothetical protein
VGKQSFRVGGPNDLSDETAAEVAVWRLSGHTACIVSLLAECRRSVDDLEVDLSSCNIDLSVVTETHFKLKHSDSAVAIDGYTIFWRDRQGLIPTFEEQCDSMDQNLFNNTLANQDHVLSNLHLHLQQLHRFMNSVPNHIAKNYLNTQDASLTQTSLPESCVK